MRPELVEGLIRWYQWKERVGGVNRQIIEIEEKKAPVFLYTGYYDDGNDFHYGDYYYGYDDMYDMYYGQEIDYFLE